MATVMKRRRQERAWSRCKAVERAKYTDPDTDVDVDIWIDGHVFASGEANCRSCGCPMDSLIEGVVAGKEAA